MYFLNILKYFKKHIINITIQLIKTYNKKSLAYKKYFINLIKKIIYLPNTNEFTKHRAKINGASG